MSPKELTEKEKQEKRRCRNPKHPTTFVDKDGRCSKAWKCSEKGLNGCVAK